MAVGSGERDRLITLQALSDTKDSSNYPTENPVDLPPKEWARRRDFSGGEQFSDDQKSAPFQTRWVIPYRADMDPELVNVAKERRVVYQGRVYDITNAVHLGQKQEIELVTLARQG